MLILKRFLGANRGLVTIACSQVELLVEVRMQLREERTKHVILRPARTKKKGP
jgi:hypothetical protein